MSVTHVERAFLRIFRRKVKQGGNTGTNLSSLTVVSRNEGFFYFPPVIFGNGLENGP